MSNPIEGSEAVQLTKWGSIQTKPSWSPDGTKLAFYSNHADKERYDLWVIEAKAGAQPKKLLEGVIPNERRGPAWTPDGSAILQVVNRPETFSPILLVSASQPGVNKALKTGTQNNSDVYLQQVADGKVLVAFTAQGRTDGPGQSGVKDTSMTHKNFKRVYLYEPSAAELSLP